MILSTSAFPLRVVSNVFVMVLILHAANGDSDEYPEVPRSLEDYDSDESFYSEEIIDRFHSNSDDNIVIDDEYPAELLERIVKETTELLESENEEERRKLKLDPSHYYMYMPIRTVGALRKLGKSFRISEDDDDRGCPDETRIGNPKMLDDISGTGHWILNVENMQQNVVHRTCVHKGSSCGQPHLMPLNYNSKCEHKSTIVYLFSIPVGKEIVKENQQLNAFEIPSECVCTLVKNRSK